MKESKARKLRIAGTAAFILYLIALVYFLFFSEGYDRNVTRTVYHYNLIPFREIRRFWDNRAVLGFIPVFTNLAGNVLAFFPFGFFLPPITRYKATFGFTVAMTFLFSLLVECIQLLTKVGCFDVDDMIMNTAGGFIGCMVFYICNAIRRSMRK